MCQFTNSHPPHPLYQSSGALLCFLLASGFFSLKFMSISWAELVWCLTCAANSWFQKIELFLVLVKQQWHSGRFDAGWLLVIFWFSLMESEQRQEERNREQRRILSSSEVPVEDLHMNCRFYYNDLTDLVTFICTNWARSELILGFNSVSLFACCYLENNPTSI